MKTCPHCGSTNRIRKRRTGIAKRIGFLKYYNCLDCRNDYYWVTPFNFPLKVKPTS